MQKCVTRRKPSTNEKPPIEHQNTCTHNFVIPSWGFHSTHWVTCHCKTYASNVTEAVCMVLSHFANGRQAVWHTSHFDCPTRHRKHTLVQTNSELMWNGNMPMTSPFLLIQSVVVFFFVLVQETEAAIISSRVPYPTLPPLTTWLQCGEIKSPKEKKAHLRESAANVSMIRFDQERKQWPWPQPKSRKHLPRSKEPCRTIL